MEKKGRTNRKYSAEFKIGVILDMRKHHLGYEETVRKYWPGLPYPHANTNNLYLLGAAKIHPMNFNQLQALSSKPDATMLKKILP